VVEDVKVDLDTLKSLMSEVAQLQDTIEQLSEIEVTSDGKPNVFAEKKWKMTLKLTNYLLKTEALDPSRGSNTAVKSAADHIRMLIQNLNML